MQNKSQIICLFAILLLFSGCISSSIYQKVERDGSSTLQVTIDISKSASAITPAALNSLRKQMQDTCESIATSKTGTSCKVDNNTMILTRSLTVADEYAFQSQMGLPYNNYKITVNKLSFNKFIPAKQKNEAGLFGVFAQPIDMTEKEQNKAFATKLKQLNISVQYDIEMPGEIVSASAGKAKPVINGNTVSFNLADALENSAPMEIESQELNVAPLLLILLVLVVAALAYLFFTTGKKKQKTSKK